MDIYISLVDLINFGKEWADKNIKPENAEMVKMLSVVLHSTEYAKRKWEDLHNEK